MQVSFINAIHSKNMIKVTFLSDGVNLIRLCAPLYFGPRDGARNKANRFHMWDYESDKRNRTFSLLPEQVLKIEVIDEKFHPSELISSKYNWMEHVDVKHC